MGDRLARTIERAAFRGTARSETAVACVGRSAIPRARIRRAGAAAEVDEVERRLRARLFHDDVIAAAARDGAEPVAGRLRRGRRIADVGAVEDAGRSRAEELLRVAVAGDDFARRRGAALPPLRTVRAGTDVARCFAVERLSVLTRRRVGARIRRAGAEDQRRRRCTEHDRTRDEDSLLHAFVITRCPRSPEGESSGAVR